MRTIKPECGCWTDQHQRDKREAEVNEMISELGHSVYQELIASNLCPEAYLYAACRMMSVILATAHGTALQCSGKQVTDDDILVDAIAMVDDGSVLAGLRDSLVNARLHSAPAGQHARETRQ